MAKTQTRRLRREVLAADLRAFAALATIDGYSPANSNFDVNTGNAKHQALNSLQSAEVQAEAAWKAARDNANAAEWAFHNYVLGVKDQVRAQFGADSNDLQGLGLKKKTEYKRPVAKKKKS